MGQFMLGVIFTVLAELVLIFCITRYQEQPHRQYLRRYGKYKLNKGKKYKLKKKYTSNFQKEWEGKDIPC